MIKPPFVRPTDEVHTVTKVFDAPLVVKGKTWLPLVQALFWGIMAWVAGKRHPERTWGERLRVGALTMPVVLGSEWCHNLAHAAAAKWAGKPVDAIRVLWGMPLLVYYDINDEEVSPRQHILRALGGPLFNAMMIPLMLLFRRFARPRTAAREVAEAALAANGFLSTVSLLPIPGIDGGPLLKWSLVAHGRTPLEADEAVRRVNGLTGAALAAAGASALKERRWLLGALLAQFGLLSLGFALGWIKEQE